MLPAVLELHGGLVHLRHRAGQVLLVGRRQRGRVLRRLCPGAAAFLVRPGQHHHPDQAAEERRQGGPQQVLDEEGAAGTGHQAEALKLRWGNFAPRLRRRDDTHILAAVPRERSGSVTLKQLFSSTHSQGFSCAPSVFTPLPCSASPPPAPRFPPWPPTPPSASAAGSPPSMPPP